MSLKSFINKRLHPFKVFREMLDVKEAEINARISELREETLRDRAIHCTEQGISDEKYCEHELIVSLTTHGRRIYDVCLAIESIMQGSLLPNRLILWLSEDFKGKPLPRTLQNQMKRGLEIRYCKDIGPYTKLVPSIKHFPNAVIVTIDDDIFYSQEMLEGLLLSYLSKPHAIHAYRIHNMTFDENGNLKSYMDWQFEVSCAEHPFFTGCGGVLYPPNSLPKETLNEEVFMSICQYADDVWFNAMAKMNNTKIVKVDTHSSNNVDYRPLVHIQERGLCEENTNPLSCRNDEQIKAVFLKYNL